MLRIPAAFDLPHALDPETSQLYLACVVGATLVSVGASYLELRRLKIAEQWERSSAFNESELLHNIGTLLFPLQVWRLTGFSALYGLGDQSEIANAVALFCLATTSLCFFALGRREHALFKKIRKTKASFGKSAGLFFRVLLGYGLLTATSMMLGIWAESLTGLLDPTFAAFFVFIPTVIFSQLALIPIFARVMFPSRSAAGTALETHVHQAFTKMRRPRPQVRFFALNDFRIFNAMIIGLGFLPGPFRQSVYISQSPEIALTDNELKAVIHHELAHGYLNHLPIRMFASVAINFLLLLIGVGIAVALPSDPFVLSAIGLAGVLALLTLQPLLLGRLVRDQEKQADEFAVFRMGSSPHDLISALAKITLASGGLRDRKPRGSWLNAAAAHPTVDERQDNLHQLETQVRTGRRATPSMARRLSSWRFRTAIFQDTLWRGLGGACLATLAGVLVVTALKSPSDRSIRVPASVEDSKAVEKYLRKMRG